jgi:hypothetical protein
MPLDFITTTTLTRSPPLGLPSLTIPLCDAGVLSVDQAAAWDAAYTADVDVVSLGPDSWQDALTDLGFIAGDDLLVALTDMFSQRVDGQQSAPDEILLARRATPVAMVRTATLGAGAAGNYTIIVNGTSYTTAYNASLTQTATDLRALINADADAVVTGTGAGANVIITADEAGVPFTSSVTHSTTPANITIASTTANIGYPEDITTWRAQDDRWYFLLLLSRSAGEIQAVAEVVEALTPNRLFVAADNDAGMASGSDTDNIASVLGDLGLTRVVVHYHNNVDQFTEWGLVGKMCGFEPGVPNWVHQELASVTGLTLTAAETTALEAKNVSWLERYGAPVPPQTSTRGGKTIAGEWIDIVHLVDAINMSIQIRVYGDSLLNANQPYRGGEPSVTSSIHGVLSSFSGAPGTAGLVLGSAIVTVPDASTQSEDDRTDRHYAGVTWSALAQGKVNSVAITGYLEQ